VAWAVLLGRFGGVRRNHTSAAQAAPETVQAPASRARTREAKEEAYTRSTTVDL
jgi:hypothetical protein